MDFSGVKGVGLLVVGLLLAGCTTFDSRWEAATVAGGSSKGPEGRWEGKWTSVNQDHSDDLRCMLVRINEHTCHAEFHATFNGAIDMDHALDLAVKPTDKGYAFHGQEDRPWFKGGRCYITGQIVGDHLTATYLDKVDHGTFEATRVK